MKVLFDGAFKQGADVERDGAIVARVPACTWSPDSECPDEKWRLIAREGEALLQIDREFGGRWEDVRSLGQLDGLTVTPDCLSGCTCPACRP